MRRLVAILVASLAATASAQPSPEWQAAAVAHILRYNRYPVLAQREGVEGTVRVRLCVRRDGRLVSVALEKTSGSSILDDAAIQAVRAANPLPALSADAAAESYFILPVTYRIAE
ncbi:energy transducer TonB [Sphingobium sp. BYY-5]|uniref:energy transducer TonB n=1 Tax=Sphingobium sp. BYY-5 TaxID=2926400 RepID=UPI001FA7858E|nr:energy transducer TonB [Sphingobium sp. BYY-5]MCI4591807.1 energy transducer TonB [Sphingobium sp. BYY-5]